MSGRRRKIKVFKGKAYKQQRKIIEIEARSLHSVILDREPLVNENNENVCKEFVSEELNEAMLKHDDETSISVLLLEPCAEKTCEELYEAMLTHDLETSMNIINHSPHVLNYKDNLGNTILHHAGRTGNFKILSFILENKNININTTNNNGESSLHSAVVANNLECCKMLLSFGINTETKNKNGQTAVDININSESANYVNNFNMQQNLIDGNVASKKKILENAKISLELVEKKKELIRYMPYYQKMTQLKQDSNSSDQKIKKIKDQIEENQKELAQEIKNNMQRESDINDILYLSNLYDKKKLEHDCLQSKLDQSNQNFMLI